MSLNRSPTLNATWRDWLGRALVALSAAGVFYSFVRFGPAALGSADLADYTKNHIVRELVFGCGLGMYVILLCAVGRSLRDYWATLVLGALIAIVFWVGTVSGYGTDGMGQVWQGLEVTSRDAYNFHVPQTVLFVIGALLMRRPASAATVDEQRSRGPRADAPDMVGVI